MSRSHASNRRRSRPRSGRRHADAGDTLLEILIAVAVIGAAALAILLAFSTDIIGSSVYRSVATADTVLRTAAEQATSQIQQAPASAWDNCTDTAGVTFHLPSGYASAITQVQYWDPSANPPAFVSVPPNPCIPNEAQLVTVSVTHDGTTNVLAFVVDDPQASPTTTAGAPAQLVFIEQPGSTITDSPISPPPVIAVEDSSGNIVTSDLSPVSIAITPGTGTSGATLSSNCVGTEFYGVVTFSNCSIAKAGTNYKLTASDGSLPQSTSAPFNVAAAPASQLVFTSAPTTQVASATTGSGGFQIQEQDVLGNAVTATAPITVSLSSSSPVGFFSLSPGGNAATAVTSVTIPSGASSSPTFYYSDTVAGTPALTGTYSAFIAASTELTVTPGPASKLAYTTPAPASVVYNTRFNVLVAEEDAFGNVETTDSSTTVTLSVSSGGGGFSCASHSLNARVANGVATFSSCEFTTSGTYVVTASAGSLTPAAATTLVTGPAAKLAYTTAPPSSVAVGTSFPVVVAEEDASGNVETGDSTTALNLTANNGGGGFSCTTTPTHVTNGVASYAGCTYTTARAGGYTLTASSGGLTPATALTVVTSGIPSQLVYTTAPPSSVSAGGTFSFTVAEEDSGGNVETTDSTTTISVAASNGGGGFSCTTAPTQVTNGVAAFAGCTFSTPAASPYTLTATSGTLTPATTTVIVVGAATQLSYTTPPPSSSAAGAKFSVVVAEEDANGNVEAGDSTTTLSLAANNGGGGFSCTTTPGHLTNGIATYSSCSYTKASSTAYTLTASSGTLTPATATTTVTPGAKATLVYTTPPPAATNAGSTFSVVVAEQDAFGNVETGDSSTSVGLSATSGSQFSCMASSVVVTNGVATFTGCSYTKASSSTYTMTASSGTLTPATATTTVAPASAAQLVYTTPPPASASAGGTFSVVVAEEDTYGNVLTGDSTTTLALAANNGGGGFTCTTTPAHVTNGVATYTGCSFTKASSTAYTLTASSGALTPATATTTVTPGGKSLLVYTTPPPASTNAGSTFTVVVAEEDGLGNVETGDSTTALSLGANNGGGGFACTTTPAQVTNGVATYAGCSFTKASSTAYTLTASSAGLASATATVAVAPGSATHLVYTTAPPATVNTGSTFGVVVAEEDAFGNVETGDSTTTLALAANNGGGGFSCTTTPTHVTNGVATYAGCTYTVASTTTYTLTASSGTLTPATSQTLVIGPAAKLLYTTPPPASTTAGATFSVVVTEEDSVGNVETGDSTTTLALSANNGGGGFSCTTTPTHVTNGVATYAGCSYTKASTTAYTLSATSGTLTPATATTTVSPAAATKLVYTTAPPGATNAGSTFGVVVAEEDTYGNVLTSDSTTTLALAANNGGGGFACTTTPTHVTNGVATYAGCSFTKASSTAYTLTASSGTLTPATATVSVAPGAGAKLVYTTAPPATTTAGATFTVVVAEEDALNNVETGDSTTTLALAANNGGGGFACTTTPTHVTNGVATYTGCSYTKSSATAYTLTASSGALTPATATTTVSAGSPAKLVFTTPPPASTTAGTTFSVVVTEEDGSGNVETTDSTTTLALAANNGGGGFACTTTPTHVTNGVATYAGCSYTKASTTAYTLTASSGTLTPATATTTVSPASATKLVYTTAPPGATNAGSTFGVVVAEEDAYGNVLTSDSTTTLALAANNGGGGFACTTTPTHVTNGVAAYAGCSFTKASSTAYTLTASSGTLTSATATVSVSPGTATQLVYTTAPPATTTTTSTFTVVVAEEDTFGNVLTGDSTTGLTLSANGFRSGFSCRTTPTRVTNGVATFLNCSITRTGTYTLTAAANGLTSAVANVTVTAGAAVRLDLVGAGRGLEAGAVFGSISTGTLTVRLLDRFGNVARAPRHGLVVRLSGASVSGRVRALRLRAGATSATFVVTHLVSGPLTLTAVARGLRHASATLRAAAMPRSAPRHTTARRWIHDVEEQWAEWHETRWWRL